MTVHAKYQTPELWSGAHFGIGIANLGFTSSDNDCAGHPFSYGVLSQDFNGLFATTCRYAPTPPTFGCTTVACLNASAKFWAADLGRRYRTVALAHQIWQLTSRRIPWTWWATPVRSLPVGNPAPHDGSDIRTASWLG